MALMVLIFLPSMLMTMYQNVMALRMDTRERATEWILQNVDRNEKISYDHYTFDLGLFDVQRYTDYGAGSDQLPDEIKRRVLEYVNHPRNVSHVSIQTRLDTTITGFDNLYDATTTQYGRKSIARLQAEGVTYLITNSWNYGPYLESDISNFTPIMREKITDVREFYMEVELTGKKVKIFRPDFWNPGPLIEIYDISREQ
jgi:hypothetical protein